MTAPSLLDRGQRAGLRLLSRAGAIPVLENGDVRRRVARVLSRGAARGFSAQAAVGRSFARRTTSGQAVRTRPTTSPGLFDLRPSEEQEMLRAAARRLAEDLIAPAGRVADDERRVPDHVHAAAEEMGLGLLGVPTALGGVADESPALTTCLVLEELARGDLSIAVALMAGGSVATTVARYGTADHQATYLPHLVGPERSANASDGARARAAIALHEPQPLFDPLAPRTTASRGRGGLLLEGTKALVPLARTAELFVVSAVLDGAPRLVLLPAATPGVLVEDDPAMGLRAAATGRLVLRSAQVPEDHLLGTADDHRDLVRRGRLAWSACAVGAAQAVLDQVVPYVKDRYAFGAPIAHRQAVAFTVADIAIELDALRLVVWRAGARLDAGLDASRQVAAARRLVTRHGTWIGSNAVQLLGGHGFVKEWANERWFRDLRGAGLLEGTLTV
ncbi:acyl-CoA dehydrogenase [Nostocoides sp. F2B08]|uniref:acyl-CoA dehydrogenase family protein n=1 Tax=Nostocoides sp. F2B08 TaxID=2653936 RepID=UPI0012630E8A|nr:acyl-CoA dehydrogenase family protein [Tetrasphaera sp. F2B08]KAB7743887.1 acyl-CoA dehydrogenase [Tetrasphaera sp. F2B08]